MKKTFKFSLCVVLICGLVISTAMAEKITGKPGMDQEKESSEIKELTIRNSGFRSKSTIVIQYRDEDKKIVAVTENGKNLPPSEFSRYESVMRIVLELPQINRLLPEIDKAYRRAESPRISAESKLREMLALKRSLTGLESDVARRYQDFTELQLLAALNSLTAKISKSSDLSQEEKIAQLKDVIERIQATELAIKEGDRRRRLQEFGTANAVRRLIEEIGNMNLESMKRMAGIEKFKFDLHLFLKQEGLLPKGKAEFVLNSKACSIDGKRLPKEIHKKIMQLCEESIGKKFDSNTKIILQLNEDR